MRIWLACRHGILGGALKDTEVVYLPTCSSCLAACCASQAMCMRISHCRHCGEVGTIEANLAVALSPCILPQTHRSMMRSGAPLSICCLGVPQPPILSTCLRTQLRRARRMMW